MNDIWYTMCNHKNKPHPFVCVSPQRPVTLFLYFGNPDPPPPVPVRPRCSPLNATTRNGTIPHDTTQKTASNGTKAVPLGGVGLLIFVTLPIAWLVFGLCLCLLVVASKWLLVGRVHPGESFTTHRYGIGGIV